MYPHRTVMLKISSAAVASAAESHIVIPGWYTSAIIKSKVTAASGTSPTLNVFVQNGVRAPGSVTYVGQDALGDYEWDDYAALTQQVAAGTVFARVVGSGEEMHAASDAALTAGQIRNGPLGGVWRVKYTIGGTNPSFTFYVLVDLIP